MEYRIIDLYDYFGRAREGAKKGYLAAYVHDDLTELPNRRVRPIMLVIPGGGYTNVSQREAEPIAIQYFAHGFDCFVLDYDVAPLGYPFQIMEAGMAMLYLRREGKRLAQEPRRIAVVGFSAGGHLAGCVSYLWDDRALKEAFGAECELIRPDASVLSYAVVTADERYWHRGSIENFCGDKVPHDAYSLEKHIRREAPPTFLWATTPDDCVPVENSLMLYSALHNAGVSVEMHLYESGWHGLSTADIEVCEPPMPSYLAHVRSWLPASVVFLRAHGFAVEVLPR